MYIIFIPKMEFSFACSPVTTRSSMAFLGYINSMSLVIQVMLLGFTLYKTSSAIKSGWGRTPVMIIFIRDGSWVFLIQFGIMVLNAALFVNAGPVPGMIVFSWLWTVLSFSTCRLVLNLYRLGYQQRQGDSRSGRSIDNSSSSASSSFHEFTTNINPGLGYIDDGSFEMAASSLEVRGRHGHFDDP
ncbi:hypothetical protein JAAARDRAFT_479813 [Jaapia argillacea MUCL 33604]|uniref:Uncharacterized protein n=1 Tax=Jaapia argillacea MUCL 33604 TaxID=933084 RepID=A0A067PCE6_9AGAM|nr:hypothetical protein JAAARDRAFT_479813 [Jaapia argillacea MUCL 33604]